MKKIKIYISILFFSIMIFTSYAFNIGSDSQFEKSSSEIKIGSQTWMTQNLDLTKFRNGDIILEVKTNEDWLKAGENKQAAWCYFDNNPLNGVKYGKLYNWYAVNDSRGIAPKGWHIPSDAEWQNLIDFLGDRFEASIKMKSNEGWKNDLNGTNESGFSALPGGFRSSYNGVFAALIDFGAFWSSTESSNSKAWNRGLPLDGDIASRANNHKNSGLSVRCIRDY